MPTNLYLRATDLADTSPYVRRARALPGGLFDIVNETILALSTEKGTSVVSVSGNGLGTAQHQDNFMGFWVSDPLDDQEIAAGDWTFRCSARAGAVSGVSNSFFALSIYLLHFQPAPADAYITRIYDADSPIGTEWPFAAAGTRGGTISGARAVATWGDRLVVEVWRHAIQDDGTFPTQSLFFNGPNDVSLGDSEANPASVLVAPTDLVFASGTDPHVVGSGRFYGKRQIDERWFFCAIGGELVPESDTTTPIPPHPQAGLRVCKRDYDELDHGTLRTIIPPPTGADEADVDGDY